MKVLSDIRLYKSQIPNIDGNSLPSAIGNRSLNVKLHRIVMKLRENGFSLGEYDHLYINFTTCNVKGKCAVANRRVEKSLSWYRFYDVEIDSQLFDNIDTVDVEEKLLFGVETVLENHFATISFDKAKIRECFNEALTLNESMLMKFKEKISAKCSAVIYLRYLDCGKYFPLLRVFDKSGQILLEKDLPKMSTLDLLGEISVSSKKVLIKPKKNLHSCSVESIEFSI